METVFAMMVAVLLGVALINSLTLSYRFATRARLMTNARAIVQRNIDAATGVVFTGTNSTPDILGLTASSGVVCDDDGGATQENIQILRSGSNILVSGTLKRFVSSEPVKVSGTATDSTATVRRITFQVDYDYLNVHYTHSETTLRSADSQ
jgi:type II secretory pathway pseudopilin PulG